MSTDAEDDAVAIISLDEAIGLPCKDLGCKEHEEKIEHADMDDSYLSVPGHMFLKFSDWSAPFLNGTLTIADAKKLAAENQHLRFLHHEHKERKSTYNKKACQLFFAVHRSTDLVFPKQDFYSGRPSWNSAWLKANKRWLDDKSDVWFARWQEQYVSGQTANMDFLTLPPQECLLISQLAIKRSVPTASADTTSGGSGSHAALRMSIQNQSNFTRLITDSSSFKRFSGFKDFKKNANVLHELQTLIAKTAAEHNVESDAKLQLTTMKACFTQEAMKDFDTLSGACANMNELTRKMKQYYAGNFSTLIAMTAFIRAPVTPSMIRTISGKPCFDVNAFLRTFRQAKKAVQDAQNPDYESKTGPVSPSVAASLLMERISLSQPLVQMASREKMQEEDGKFTEKTFEALVESVRSAAKSLQISSSNAGWVEITDQDHLNVLAAAETPGCAHCKLASPGQTSRHNHDIQNCWAHKRLLQGKGGGSSDRGGRGGKGRGRGNYDRGGRGNYGRGGRGNSDRGAKGKRAWKKFKVDTSSSRQQQMAAFEQYLDKGSEATAPEGEKSSE